MKLRTLSILFLIMFATGIVLATAGEILPNNSIANYESGTLLIKDSATNQTVNTTYEAKGICYKVVDGDTIWVEGVGKIRLVGINTPEKGEDGFYDSKNFVEEKCLNKEVYLDIDDEENKDKYNRTLAIVYTKDTNINKALLEEDLAEVMYIPPSEFTKGLGFK